MSGVGLGSGNSAKENEKGKGNVSMRVESMEWGMIGTDVGGGVRRCWDRGWGLVQVGVGMQGV